MSRKRIGRDVNARACAASDDPSVADRAPPHPRRRGFRPRRRPRVARGYRGVCLRRTRRAYVKANAAGCRIHVWTTDTPDARQSTAPVQRAARGHRRGAVFAAQANPHRGPQASAGALRDISIPRAGKNSPTKHQVPYDKGEPKPTVPSVISSRAKYSCAKQGTSLMMDNSDVSRVVFTPSR